MEKNELKTQLITLCDLALVDNKGKLSIIGLFDMLHVAQFPGGVPHCFFVTVLAGAPNSDYELKLRVNHAGEMLNEVPLKTKTSPNGKANILMELMNFGFKEAGEYVFEVLHNSTVVGTFPFNVYHVKPQGAKLTN